MEWNKATLEKVAENLGARRDELLITMRALLEKAPDSLEAMRDLHARVVVMLNEFDSMGVARAQIRERLKGVEDRLELDARYQQARGIANRYVTAPLAAAGVFDAAAVARGWPGIRDAIYDRLHHVIYGAAGGLAMWDGSPLLGGLVVAGSLYAFVRKAPR